MNLDPPILPLARGHLGVYISRVASTLASVHLAARRTAEAPPLLEQAAEHGRAIGFTRGRSLVLALLAEGYLHAERLADASRTAGEALELARKHGERGRKAWTLRVFGGSPRGGRRARRQFITAPRSTSRASLACALYRPLPPRSRPGDRRSRRAHRGDRPLPRDGDAALASPHRGRCRLGVEPEAEDVAVS
jgi:hypothetical protein